MSQKPPHKSHLLPSLDVAILYPKSAALSFSPRDIRALFEHTEFSTLESRSHQTCFLPDYAGKTLNRLIDTKELSDIFEMSERTIRRILAKGPQDPSPSGPHRAMDDGTGSTFVQIIAEAFHRGQALTNKEMLQIICERNHFLTKGWLHAFIGHHLGQLQICHSLPQEDTRMIVPQAHLEEYIQLAKLVIAGMFSELVLNLDEVGSSDWEDRRPKKVIVPRSVSPDDVYRSVSR
jgi:hypothetical protein